ncbi:MAG: AAA family ATPase [Deltaproteobacteria bacterium]|nr:AAA family ATPase [Deltaproteobacteria bacterium]
MYTTFFNLRENPFSLTPDPRYLYLSPQHRAAMNHLIYGIHEKKGFILITGGIGTGKTTICRAIIKKLDPSVQTALILNPFLSDIELLETILQEFGIPFEGPERTKKNFIDALNGFLLTNFTAGRNAVVFIDEAQNLPRATLEQIRMLSNLETEQEKLIQIVLVGQPELQEILASPTLRQINDRIMLRYHLEPINRDNVRHYIEHRLSVAGVDGQLSFDDGAFEKIYEFSRGYPRRINAICDRALLVAYTENARRIEKETILNAMNDMNANYMTGGQTVPSRGKRWLVPVLILVFAVLVATGVIYGSQLLRLISPLRLF